MELKTKYQYSYFIYPYYIEKEKYDKYILKLLKDKKCKFKVFEKEKDLDIYNYFLPNIRKYMFPTFELRDEKLKEFNSFSLDKKKKYIAKQTVSYFNYELAEDIQGKVGNENGIFFKIDNIEIVCFNTGICFIVIKTNMENSNNFSDLLDFNYRFKEINSEFSSLKNYENIKIQTSSFQDMTDIKELINQITGISISNSNSEISSSHFFTFSYACLESDNWNDKTSFEYLENDFLKYVNVLPRNYSSDFDKTNIEQNLHVIEKFKYHKTGITKNSVSLMCSGIDTYNYTKLPYEYENQILYIYLICLYKKMYLRKTNLEFKNYDKSVKLKDNFIRFTKEVWESEISADDTGIKFYKTIHKTLELEDQYEEISKKYEIVYKDLNIEKNNIYYSIIVILLIFSLMFNTINIIFLMYFL